jgi:BASS family bile acid:Na+ symporter
MEDSLFASLLLPVALAVIMTSLGMSLTVDDSRRVVVYPRGVSIGLANLLLISPLLAFAIAGARRTGELTRTHAPAAE